MEITKEFLIERINLEYKHALESRYRDVTKSFNFNLGFSLEELENKLLETPVSENSLLFIEEKLSNEEYINYAKEIRDLLLDIIENQTIPEDISTYIFNDLFLAGNRFIYNKIVGFSVVTRKFTRTLKEKIIKDSKCLEIMCGNGYLSKALREEGVDIIATDNYSINYGFINRVDGIIEMDCLEAIKTYGKDVDYIICSWIPYDNEIGYEALKLMNEINPNCKMISINEYRGCCAEGKFFDHQEILEEYDYKDSFMSLFTKDDEQEETLHFKSWHGYNDFVSIIRYKEEIN